MTYIFFVQGEGRGHLTQALTLKAKLEKNGHQILAAVAGPDPAQALPAFFEDQFRDQLIRIYSPTFVVDKSGQGINLVASITRALSQLNRYRQSIKQIRKILRETNPDVIVNFYEPLVGLYYRLYRDKRPLFCLGHQFFIAHPDFIFPPSHISDRCGLRFYNWIVAPSRGTKIAFSFTEAKDLKSKRLLVCPPLMRQTLKELKPTRENYILAYFLNAGYSQEIINWSKSNPGIKIVAFWNKPNSKITVISPDLIFYNLNGEQFINHLAHCTAYASTAGFESISEAAYLQKDILMIPTKNHFEQKCNATDAKRAGLALISENFDLSILIKKKEKTRSDESLWAFKRWNDDFDNKIVDILENKSTSGEI